MFPGIRARTLSLALRLFPDLQIMSTSESNRAHRGSSEQNRLWWQIGLTLVVFGIIAWQAWEKRQAALDKQAKADAKAAEKQKSAAEKVSNTRSSRKAASDTTAAPKTAEGEESVARTTNGSRSKRSSDSMNPKSAETAPVNKPASSKSKPTPPDVAEKPSVSVSEETQSGRAPPVKEATSAASANRPTESARAPPPATSPQPKPPAGKLPASKPVEKQPGRVVVTGVTLRDLDGNVVYKGDVDLTDSLRRIDSEERIERFRNDGIVFQNREGKLPKRAAGYYHEWVHPTPKLNGPGPQRIVTGEGGEAWYTADHYKSFKKIR